MIVYGICEDGRWRMRRPGAAFIAGAVFVREEFAVQRARNFAAGGRVQRTVFTDELTDEERDAPSCDPTGKGGRGKRGPRAAPAPKPAAPARGKGKGKAQSKGKGKRKASDPVFRPGEEQRQSATAARAEESANVESRARAARAAADK